MNGQYRIVQLIFVCIRTSVALIVFLDRVYNVVVCWLAQAKRRSATEAERDGMRCNATHRPRCQHG